MFSTFGHILRVTTFGESHGKAMGGVIDGFPSGIHLDEGFILEELERRRPGCSALVTQRKETDQVEFLSGILNGVTLGTPIGFFIQNADARHEDYEALKDVLRPSHADWTYQEKYGIRDTRGGGRASGRETVSRVVAGALCKIALKEIGVSIQAFVSGIGPVSISKDYKDLDLSKTWQSPVFCPDESASKEMESLLETVRQEKDSVGGVVTCLIKGCPKGLGEPVFGKLEASLASAMLSIGAVRGFEIGDGFGLSKMHGSQANDAYQSQDGQIRTLTNHGGGVLGGISSGEDILLRAAFKPTPTIALPQMAVNAQGQEMVLEAKGRHDPCVAIRACKVVEAMAAITILDHYLINKSRHL